MSASPPREASPVSVHPSPPASTTVSLDVDSDDDHDRKLPLATDHEFMKQLVFPPLIENPDVLEENIYTWTVENYGQLPKKCYSPVFDVAGNPFRIMLFPFGNDVDHCSIYLAHGFADDEIPADYCVCVQFGIVMWNPHDPSVFHQMSAQHRFTRDDNDWGFTRFLEIRKLHNTPFRSASPPICQEDRVNISAYVRVFDDVTGVLFHHFKNYNSKKVTGYVGLKNLGATCYLNSLLQSLYFTNAFRRAIYEIPERQEPDDSDSAVALQRLFCQLQTSDKAVSTTELTKSFGWETRHIFEQQDVQELSRKLMERMEEYMKGTPAEKVLAELFSGKVKTYIHCINVQYESSRVEDFWDIQLNVSGNPDLEASFYDYIQVEKLDGDNQYYAGEEYKLQDANKGIIFNSFPDVLHLQLKRFEYDIQRDMMMKINDRYEFPEIFDASPFLSKAEGGEGGEGGEKEKEEEEPWTYQLHGVLVHSGDLNAGHYYAFIKPEKDGWFYRYDDDRVTRASMHEVLEENYGGESRVRRRLDGDEPNQPAKRPVMRTSSAYMLVYIRQSRVDRVLQPITVEDIPAHIRNKMKEEEEERLREVQRNELRKQELDRNIEVRIVTTDTFRYHDTLDIASFEAKHELYAMHPESAPISYQVERVQQMQDVQKLVAQDLGLLPQQIRLWNMITRQNHTIRPNRLVDTQRTVLEEYKSSPGHRNFVMKLWVDVSQATDEPLGSPVWPPPSTHALLFLKKFDPLQQELRGVCSIHVSKKTVIESLLPLVAEKLELAHVPTTDQVRFLEEIKPGMIDPLKWHSTIEEAELQNGDIITVELLQDPDLVLAGIPAEPPRIPGRQTSAESTEARDTAPNDVDPDGSGDVVMGTSRTAVEDILPPPPMPKDLADKNVSNYNIRLDKAVFENALDFYSFLMERRIVQVSPHPTRSLSDAYPTVKVGLCKHQSYEAMSFIVGKRLKVPPTYLRFWTVLPGTDTPRAVLSRHHQRSVQKVFAATDSMPAADGRVSALHYEVLPMTLGEFDAMKTINVHWLPEGVVKEEIVELLLPQQATIAELVQALVAEKKLASVAEAGPIRIYEANNSRFFRELNLDQPVSMLYEYTIVYAERVPEEERPTFEARQRSLGDEADKHLITASHFSQEHFRIHGIPFRFLMVPGEVFADTKKRLEARTHLRGRVFERIKFALLNRARITKPYYLTDDDVLSELVEGVDDSLGLDHPDQHQPISKGLFLR